MRTVYEAALQNPQIRALLLILPVKVNSKCVSWTYSDINFYTKNYSNVCKAYDEETKTWFDLKRYKPDYIIYERPYGNCLPYTYRSDQTVEYAKVIYIPYGYILTKSEDLLNIVLPPDFLRNMSIFFASWEGVENYCREYFKENKYKNRKVVNLGFPRFDLTNTISGKKYDEFTILWIPRWTVAGVNSKDTSEETSFFEFKDCIIDRCKIKKDEFWMIRPHPLAFQNYLAHGLMSDEEVDEYKESIKCMSNAALDNQKDYLPGFERADVLLADFSSLIIEYYITGKPIIYCGNVEALPMEELKKSVYIANDWGQVVFYIEELKAGVDPLRAVREEVIRKKIGIRDDLCIGENIVRYIINDYNNE